MADELRKLVIHSGEGPVEWWIGERAEYQSDVIWFIGRIEHFEPPEGVLKEWHAELVTAAGMRMTLPVSRLKKVKG